MFAAAPCAQGRVGSKVQIPQQPAGRPPQDGRQPHPLAPKEQAVTATATAPEIPAQRPATTSSHVLTQEELDAYTRDYEAGTEITKGKAKFRVFHHDGAGEEPDWWTVVMEPGFAVADQTEAQSYVPWRARYDGSAEMPDGRFIVDYVAVDVPPF